MTRQIRTWHECETVKGEPKRWDVRINGVPVPGGSIVQTGEEAFQVLYPRLAPRTFGSLEEAKQRIELAQPITKAGLAVGKPLEDVDDEDLISPDEAGELLGLSRFRVNAMVANGVLAGIRKNGRVLVSRASVEAKRDRVSNNGPTGRFAHAFVEYRTEAPDEALFIVEIDTEDAREYEEARYFVQSVVDGGEPGCVEALNYHQAMARCAQARRSGDPLPTGPIPFKAFRAGLLGAPART